MTSSNGIGFRDANAVDGTAFSFDDDDGWQDMPVIRVDGFDDELNQQDSGPSRYNDRESRVGAKATGDLIDFDAPGTREAQNTKESEYTRLRLQEEDDADEVHLRTKYLFDEDTAMTPLSQMQATKNLLTETQRIAYVGLCFLTCREMRAGLKSLNHKELKGAVEGLEVWSLKIMGRLYYHMELETPEQKMIQSLAEHGVQAADLVPPLMTTHKVANPEYDPTEARKQAEEREQDSPEQPHDSESSVIESPRVEQMAASKTKELQTTANVLTPKDSVMMPGVSTSLSSADENVTLDIRWTVLCDLFLILVADSVYDARSRVLLEAVALKLGLTWLDVVRFEQRVTDALEIQEGVDKLEQTEVLEGRAKSSKRRRYAMMGLATLGGGLVIGLSAGLLAPVIGAGLGAAFATIGVSGTTGFLAGAGGAAVITTAGTLTGSGIAAKGMARRTQNVRVFDLLPLHNNKRVNCILTVSGFMTSKQDDVRLPFSVLDPIVGDVFSVLWEPEMLGEAGSALKLIGSEIISQVGTTVLQATVMTALMSALQWPILLTKLGYLIDNPWSNALDRAKAAGTVLADVLIRRSLGVRPITLIGFSLGARLIFYCLLELARKKAYGIVQDVFLLGATLTASQQAWIQARSVVAGRLVNGYARNDWLLNYLFRATNAGLSNIAGLRPVQGVPGLENVDVTDKIAGHTSYRMFMPLILDQLGFPVVSEYFDEPETDDMIEERIVIQETEDAPEKKGWFRFKKKKTSSPARPPVRPPPSGASHNTKPPAKDATDSDLDLPERIDIASRAVPNIISSSLMEHSASNDSELSLPARAGFDLDAIKEAVVAKEPKEELPRLPAAQISLTPPIPTPRSTSTPYAFASDIITVPSPVPRPSSVNDIHKAESSMQEMDLGSDQFENAHPKLSYSNDLSPSLAGPSTSTTPRASPISPYRRASEIPTPDAAEEDVFGDFSRARGPLSNVVEEPFTFSSRNNGTSGLSFGGGDGSIWAPASSTKDTYSGYGRRGINLGHARSPYSTFETSAPETLSFGGYDGSLSFDAASDDRDTWRPPPLKKGSSDNMNPWN